MRILRYLTVLLFLLPFSTMASIAQPSFKSSVWRGAIGNLPIVLCIDQGAGAYYYYEKQKYTIALDMQEAGYIEPGNYHDSEINATWIDLNFTANTGNGTWISKKSANTLPIKLKLMADISKQRNVTCSDSSAFNSIRLKSTLVERAAPVTDSGHQYIAVRAPKLDISSVLLADSSPIAKKINQQLNAEFNNTVAAAYNCISFGEPGDFNATLSRAFRDKQWISFVDTSDDYCGGPHPDEFITYITFDLATGAKIEPMQWFKDPKELPASLRKLIVDQWQEKAQKNPADFEHECISSWNDNRYYSVRPTYNGLLFTPEFPHIANICVNDVSISSAALKPFLNEVGLKATGQSK
jgi:hypothetical protein